MDTEIRVATTIHSHCERTETLKGTLGHLKNNFGLTPFVSIQDSPPDPARNRLNARDALAMARPWPAGGVLMLEDDVRLDPDIGNWIALAIGSERPTFLYSAYSRNHPDWFSAAHNRNPQNMPHFARGLYRLERAPEVWGAQAVYLPKMILSMMWNDPRLHSTEMDGSPIDGFFRRFFVSIPKRYLPLLALPNPVEHLSPPAVLNKRRAAHTSLSRRYIHLATGEGIAING